MQLRSLSPEKLGRFVQFVESAVENPDEWPRSYASIADMFSASGRRHYRQAWPQDPQMILNRLSADHPASEEEREAVYKAYAAMTAECAAHVRESKTFLKALGVDREMPELRTSAEWALLRDSLFDPTHIPDEVWFLQADPANSFASCVTAEEAAEILELDQKEHLLARLPIYFPLDVLTFRSMLGLTASQKWLLWFYEVA